MTDFLPDSYQGLDMFVHDELVPTGPWEYKGALLNGTLLNGPRCIRNNRTMLYVTTSDSNPATFNVIDARNPSQLILVDSVDAAFNAIGLYLDGGFAYVAGYGNNRVDKYDISVPGVLKVPTSSSTTSLTGISDVDVYGNHVYCACEPGGGAPVVRVDKNSLTILNNSGAVFSGNGLGVVDEQGIYYYTVQGGGGQIRVWDISNVGIGPVGPLGPGISSGVKALRIRGHYLYCHSAAGLTIFDIGIDPISPPLVGGLSLINFTGFGRLDFYQNKVFVCNSTNSAVAIFDVTDQAHPTLSQILTPTELPGLSAPFDIAIYNHYGYITSRNSDQITVIGEVDQTIHQTHELLETFLSFSPNDFWHYPMPNNAPDLGSDGIGQIMQGGSPLMGWYGPNNIPYPECGNGRRDFNAMRYFRTAEAFADVYTTGYTFVVVVWPKPDPTGFSPAGDIMRRNRPGGASTQAESVFAYSGADHFPSSRFAAGTSQLSNTNAQVRYDVDSSPANQWYVLEVYFPPGSSMPVLYKQGNLITNVSDSSFGARTNTGAGALNTGGNFSSGSAVLKGYYAMSGVWKRQLTSTERAAYKQSAQIEGWIP